MSLLFGREWKKRELMKRIGRLSQVGGVRQYEFSDGKARGLRALEVKTGSGLSFSVLLDRAMDIGPAEFSGHPLCWHSCVGLTHPSFFIPCKDHWLSSFGGGLVTTCGLSNVGIPNTDAGKEYNLHGSITGSPAENVKIDYTWHGENLDISIEGTVREASVFGPNLSLHRLIWTRLGEKKIFIEDQVTNEGYERTPLMILYHINVGWPIIDEETMLIMPTKKIVPRDEEAEKGKDDYGSFTTPQKHFKEQVFFHEMIPDSSNYIHAAVINPRLNHSCFGLYIKYLHNELPHFTQWKMMGEGTYVLGLEPGNCGVIGREAERKEGTLPFLGPGKTTNFHLEIGMITTPEELNQISDLVDDLISK